MTTTTTTTTTVLADITLGDRVEHHDVEYHVYGLHRLTTRDHIQVDLQVERITDGAESVISGPGDQRITVRST